MRKHTLWIISLALATAGPSHAKTFTHSPLAPDLGLDVLTRRVARERVGRDLFSDPYATVTVGNVDVYDRFPYVEARRFQIVSDPRWNRLVCAEGGRTLRAFDGRGTALGPLSEPHGMAVDEDQRVYVADTGNDRIVVLRATTTFDEITLVPLFAIDGLSRPHDVAYSDGGTPFTAGDDRLYVADTGKNRVVAVALEGAGARVIGAVGDLGSGDGRFAGPMAITVGRDNDGNTHDVYVADAHNRRIVHLRDEGARLAWVSATGHGADVVTSLSTDAWGNVYAAAPNLGVVQKFSPALMPVAELRTDLARPRGFHIPFLNVRDHRNGSVTRVGQPNAVSVDEWSDGSGVRLWSLGVEVARLSVSTDARPVARFTLTDRAAVSIETRDGKSGRTLARRAIGALAAGSHEVPLTAEDLRGAGPAGAVVRVTAASSYPDGEPDMAQTGFVPAGGAAVIPAQAVLLGSTPNPALSFARIGFMLPVGSGDAVLGIFDAGGRRVRSFDSGFAPGFNEVLWDGTDARGIPVQAGVYFYRLDVEHRRLTQSLVLVR